VPLSLGDQTISLKKYLGNFAISSKDLLLSLRIIKPKIPVGHKPDLFLADTPFYVLIYLLVVFWLWKFPDVSLRPKWLRDRCLIQIILLRHFFADHAQLCMKCMHFQVRKVKNITLGSSSLCGRLFKMSNKAVNHFSISQLHKYVILHHSETI